MLHTTMAQKVPVQLGLALHQTLRLVRLASSSTSVQGTTSPSALSRFIHEVGSTLASRPQSTPELVTLISAVVSASAKSARERVAIRSASDQFESAAATEHDDLIWNAIHASVAGDRSVALLLKNISNDLRAGSAHGAGAWALQAVSEQPTARLGVTSPALPTDGPDSTAWDLSSLASVSEAAALFHTRLQHSAGAGTGTRQRQGNTRSAAVSVGDASADTVLYSSLVMQESSRRASIALTEARQQVVDMARAHGAAAPSSSAQPVHVPTLRAAVKAMSRGCTVLSSCLHTGQPCDDLAMSLGSLAGSLVSLAGAGPVLQEHTSTLVHAAMLLSYQAYWAEDKDTDGLHEAAGAVLDYVSGRAGQAAVGTADQATSTLTHADTTRLLVAAAYHAARAGAMSLQHVDGRAVAPDMRVATVALHRVAAQLPQPTPGEGLHLAPSAADVALWLAGSPALDACAQAVHVLPASVLAKALQALLLAMDGLLSSVPQVSLLAALLLQGLKHRLVAHEATYLQDMLGGGLEKATKQLESGTALHNLVQAQLQGVPGPNSSALSFAMPARVHSMEYSRGAYGPHLASIMGQLGIPHRRDVAVPPIAAQTGQPAAQATTRAPPRADPSKAASSQHHPLQQAAIGATGSRCKDSQASGKHLLALQLQLLGKLPIAVPAPYAVQWSVTGDREAARSVRQWLHCRVCPTDLGQLTNAAALALQASAETSGSLHGSGQGAPAALLAQAAVDVLTACGDLAVCHALAGENSHRDELVMAHALATAGLSHRGLFAALARRAVARASYKVKRHGPSLLRSMAMADLLHTLSCLSLSWEWDVDAYSAVLAELQYRQRTGTLGMDSSPAGVPHADEHHDSVHGGKPGTVPKAGLISTLLGRSDASSSSSSGLMFGPEWGWGHGLDREADRTGAMDSGRAARSLPLAAIARTAVLGLWVGSPHGTRLAPILHPIVVGLLARAQGSRVDGKTAMGGHAPSPSAMSVTAAPAALSGIPVEVLTHDASLAPLSHDMATAGLRMRDILHAVTDILCAHVRPVAYQPVRGGQTRAGNGYSSGSDSDSESEVEGTRHAWAGARGGPDVEGKHPLPVGTDDGVRVWYWLQPSVSAGGQDLTGGIDGLGLGMGMAGDGQSVADVLAGISGGHGDGASSAHGPSLALLPPDLTSVAVPVALPAHRIVIDIVPPSAAVPVPTVMAGRMGGPGWEQSVRDEEHVGMVQSWRDGRPGQATERSVLGAIPRHLRLSPADALQDGRYSPTITAAALMCHGPEGVVHGKAARASQTAGPGAALANLGLQAPSLGAMWRAAVLQASGWMVIQLPLRDILAALSVRRRKDGTLAVDTYGNSTAAQAALGRRKFEGRGTQGAASQAPRLGPPAPLWPLERVVLGALPAGILSSQTKRALRHAGMAMGQGQGQTSS